VLLSLRFSIAFINEEKTLMIAHSSPSTANTTAMQNIAIRILSDKDIEITSFLVYKWILPVK
jgi:hypothetical protein